MPGSRKTKATDWEVAATGSASGGLAIGAGGWVFQFRSKSADIRHKVVFIGAGLSAGLKAGGDGSTGLSASDFTSIVCDTSFSLNDLHNTFGRLTAAGGGAIRTAGATFISAGAWTDLFTSQAIYGLSWGAGLGASTNGGIWRLHGAPLAYGLIKPSAPAPKVPGPGPKPKVVTPAQREKTRAAEAEKRKTRQYRMPRILPGQSVPMPPFLSHW